MKKIFIIFFTALAIVVPIQGMMAFNMEMTSENSTWPKNATDDSFVGPDVEFKNTTTMDNETINEGDLQIDDKEYAIGTTAAQDYSTAQGNGDSSAVKVTKWTNVTIVGICILAGIATLVLIGVGILYFCPKQP